MAGRIILIEPSEDGRETLAERLRMQGYRVTVAPGPAEGAHLALSAPPAAVIDRADRSMYAAKTAGRTCVRPEPSAALDSDLPTSRDAATPEFDDSADKPLTVPNGAIVSRPA